MPYLPDLSDRVWFALHCLPRDENGEPPTYRKLERECNLSNGLLSKMALGQRSHQWSATFRACSSALRVSEAWLQYGGGGGPTPTGVVPPCPAMRWIRHCELSGWTDAVTIALRLERAPLGAYLAGAELPVYRKVEKVTPEFATAVALYAWETATAVEQAEFATKDADRDMRAHRDAAKQRATPLRRTTGRDLKAK